MSTKLPKLQLKFNIAGRFWAVLALTIIGMIGVGILAASNLEKRIYAEKRQELKYIVETATSQINAYHVRFQKGEISEEFAQKKSLEAISSIRYDGNNYLWVNDMKPTMVMHPLKPELDGKDLSANKDPNGKYLFNEFVKTVKASGSGYVDYAWPKPGAQQPVAKLSYVTAAPWGWVVGTGVYIDDVQNILIEDMTNLAQIGGGLAVLIAGLSLILARGITGPMAKVAQAMKAIAEGKNDTNIPYSARKDEVGDIAKALVVFRDNSIERARLRGEQVEKDKNAEADRKQALLDMADRLEHTVCGITDVLLASANHMQQDSATMSGEVQTTIQNTQIVAESARQASMNIGTVAAAVEELSASIREISHNVSTSSQVASNAVVEVQNTNIQVQSLSKLSGQIGEIVTIIQNIAEQTNLLALNATIEAARAGEAGKGFAVVASEVKTLASQTSKATEQINQQINHIQSATVGVVNAMEGFGRTIDQINQISSTIAAAVEQQSAATNEISSSVASASHSSSSVAGLITNVSASVDNNGKIAAEFMQQTQTLNDQAGQLQSEVQNFIASVRAA